MVLDLEGKVVAAGSSKAPVRLRIIRELEEATEAMLALQVTKAAELQNQERCFEGKRTQLKTISSQPSRCW